MSEERHEYGVVGYPLEHSMSPYIHRELFARAGIAARYDVLSVPDYELGVLLGHLFTLVDGLNITIPHKQAVIPYLDGLEGIAAAAHTVNTIAVRRTAGGTRTVGCSTDGAGFLFALAHAGIPLAGRVTILGGGGASRTFAAQAALAGCAITCAVREGSLPGAFEMRADIRAIADAAGVARAPYDILTFERLEAADAPIDLLINGTPVGMYPRAGACPVSEAVIARSAAVFDAVYNPRRTPLLAHAHAHGIPGAEGMPMLVGQAIAAHAFWYGGDFDDQTVAQVIEVSNAELAARFA